VAAVTMRDIARLAGGVHQSTVSLALRNAPVISLATRMRIQRIARTAGYHRDPLLDAFNVRRVQSRQSRSHPVLAFVSDFDSRKAMEASPLHASLWRGAAHAAESLYHRLEPFFLGPRGLSPVRLDSILFNRGIDGLVTAAFRPTTPPLRLAWERYCGVRVECQNWRSPHITVATDLLQGTRTAFRRAKQLGYNRIGLLLEPDENARNDLALAGYLVEHAKVTGHPAPLVAPQFRSAARLREWIKSNRIDAILSAGTGTGGLLAAIDLQPGRDLGWACLALSRPDRSIAGQVADSERAGALAVEQVVGLSRLNLRGPASSAMITYVPSTWQDGASLPSRHLLGGV